MTVNQVAILVRSSICTKRLAATFMQAWKMKSAIHTHNATFLHVSLYHSLYIVSILDKSY